MKLVILSDLHFAASDSLTDRHGQFADIFLIRLVRRINRFIQPDVTLVLGDILDNPTAPDAEERLRALRAILDKLKTPWIILPGNHDPAPDSFYRYMPDPRPWVEFQGVRFASFFDEDRPGFNGFRPPHEQARLAAARAGFDGQLVCLQHNSLHATGTLACPYNLTNAEVVLQDMQRQQVALSVSGHYHEGAMAVDSPVPTLIVPALCSPSLPFVVVELFEGRPPVVSRHTLSLPAAYRLIDYHVHTSLAYCNENMDCAKTVALARLFGLHGLAFAEHTAHLYFRRQNLRHNRYWTVDFETMRPSEIDDRADEYWRLVEPFRSNLVRAGLEADLMFVGHPFVRPSDWQKAEIRIGAVHQLPSLQLGNRAEQGKVADEYLALIQGLASSGIHILAHPFRVFRRGLRTEPPSRLFAPVCRLLKAYGIAAEINFHTNEPSPEFLAMCLREGVKLAFGSDAHNLCEVGDFQAALDLLAAAGIRGDPSEALWQDRIMP
ncbi:MAG: metallophosphoesterase [Verrucomicrobia bacterium]|nr:metallophosphoesterase [Verrucomicrobiota bacterium]